MCITYHFLSFVMVHMELCSRVIMYFGSYKKPAFELAFLDLSVWSASQLSSSLTFLLAAYLPPPVPSIPPPPSLPLDPFLPPSLPPSLPTYLPPPSLPTSPLPPPLPAWIVYVLCCNYSLIPRPCPAFCHLQYGKAGWGLGMRLL